MCRYCMCALVDAALSLRQGMGGGDSSRAHDARAEGAEHAGAGGGPSQGSPHSGPRAD